MYNIPLKDKTWKSDVAYEGTDDECVKNTCLLYIKSWISQGNVEQPFIIEKEDSGGLMCRKSRLRDLQAEILNARVCEILPIIIGHRDAKSRQRDREISVIRGQVGCGEWFRRFTDISKAVRVCGWSEDARQLRLAKKRRGIHPIKKASRSL